MSFPPGYPPPPPTGDYNQPPFQEAFPNYLWQSIAVTVLGVLCCPAGLVSSAFGVAALVTSSRIAQKQRDGDSDGALAASKRTRACCIAGAVALVVAMTFNIIYYVVVV